MGRIVPEDQIFAAIRREQGPTHRCRSLDALDGLRAHRAATAALAENGGHERALGSIETARWGRNEHAAEKCATRRERERPRRANAPGLSADGGRTVVR